MVEDRTIMSVKYCLPVQVFYFWRKLERTLQRGLSAIAEHLVINFYCSAPMLLRFVIGALQMSYDDDDDNWKARSGLSISIN